MDQTARFTAVKQLKILFWLSIASLVRVALTWAESFHWCIWNACAGRFRI